MIIDVFVIGFYYKVKKYVQSVHPLALIIKTDLRTAKRNHRCKSEEKSCKYSFPYVEINDRLAEKYKERVRDFLVKVTSKPVKLGKYQPPINNIERKTESQKVLSNAQLLINGFKSNKDRVEVRLI